MDFRLGDSFDFDDAARFVARLVEEIERRPAAATGRCSTSTCPAGEVAGVEVTRLGKRIYRDELKLDEEDADGRRRRYWIYGTEPGFDDEPGTDLAAVAAGRIAVTPVHFDLTDIEGITDARALRPRAARRPAARDVE